MIFSYKKNFFRKWLHYLFSCPTFWSMKGAFVCIICGQRKKCYYDGNDIKDVGTDICDRCAKAIGDFMDDCKGEKK